MIHRGFYEIYQTVMEGYIENISPLIAAHPEAVLVFTGHSLGGALTSFAAAHVKRHLNPPNKFLVYTFGSPRMGNQAFADYLMTLFPADSYYRVVHSQDIVPHCPLQSMGFSHAGEEVWYPEPDSDISRRQICSNAPG